MIRVLHVLSAPAAGGAEIYVRDLVKVQKASGAVPHIAFLASARDADRDPIFEAVFLAQLDELGIPYFIIGHDCRLNLLKGIWRVTRYCRRHSITHYHAHLIYGLIFGAILRIPRFFTEHNHRVRGGIMLRRLLNNFVEAYIAISRECAITLQKAVGRSTITIYNGVDPGRITINSPSRRPLGYFRLLAVGRVGPQKNYSLLIEALAHLEGKVEKQYIVDVAGDGSAEAIAELEAQAAAAGIAHRIRFLGNRTDVANLMASSDLLVLSSAWEGLPIVLLEAVTAQLPFIATDVGGCSEITEITGAGLVVPPGDAETLAEAIRELLSNGTKLNAMRVSAALHADSFTIENSAKAHFSLYKQTFRKKLY